MNQQNQEPVQESTPASPSEPVPQPAQSPKHPRKVSLSVAIFLALLLSVAVFISTFTVMYMQSRAAVNQQKAALAKYSKLDALLAYAEQNYVREFDETAAWNGIYTGLFAAIGDPYTTYLTQEDYQAYLADHSGQFVGIGVNVVFDPTTGSIYIYRVLADSPAERAGLQAGDRIVAVGDLLVNASTYTDAVNAVVGEENTVVSLTIRREDKTLTRSITRAAVRSQNVLYEQLENHIAYITILSFSDNSVCEQFEAALKQAQTDGCTSYLFDLRNNPGGNLDVICKTLDLLLPEGPIVHIVSADGKTETRQSDAEHSLQAPMVVLCNGNTASAAELFTADLRDYGLATLVGDTTYGKGTMQTITRLSDGSAVKLTTRYYNPASNQSYDGVGIVPDIPISLSADEQSRFYMLTHEEDRQLQAAIACLNEKH